MKRLDVQVSLADFDTSFHEHLSEIVPSSDLKRALIPNPRRVTVLFRCPEQKKLLSDYGNQKYISLDGTLWQVIPTHRFRNKSKKRKRKFICTAEHKYNKYLKFSSKKRA